MLFQTFKNPLNYPGAIFVCTLAAEAAAWASCSALGCGVTEACGRMGGGLLRGAGALILIVGDNRLVAPPPG